MRGRDGLTGAQPRWTDGTAHVSVAAVGTKPPERVYLPRPASNT
jgi:hypothetical protein